MDMAKYSIDHRGLPRDNDHLIAFLELIARLHTLVPDVRVIIVTVHQRIDGYPGCPGDMPPLVLGRLCPAVAYEYHRIPDKDHESGGTHSLR